MTDANKPWEQESAPNKVPLDSENQPTLLDQLKQRAEELGVSFAANIGEDTLAQRIAEAEDAMEQDDAKEPALDSTGQPKSGAQLGKDAHVDTTVAEFDGTSEDQKQRVEDAGIVIDGEQAPLALVNLISQGYTMKKARKILAKASKNKKKKIEA